MANEGGNSSTWVEKGYRRWLARYEARAKQKAFKVGFDYFVASGIVAHWAPYVWETPS